MSEYRKPTLTPLVPNDPRVRAIERDLLHAELVRAIVASEARMTGEPLGVVVTWPDGSVYEWNGERFMLTEPSTPAKR